MNEYELRQLNRLILLGTTILMLCAWSFLAIVTNSLFSFLVAVVVSVIGITGLIFSWIVGMFKKEYVNALDLLLAEASRYKPLSEMIVSSSDDNKTVASMKSLRWSVQQYRNYNDFMYGSFDSYVTEGEIIVRGRLKRGQQSLYMKINGPYR